MKARTMFASIAVLTCTFAGWQLGETAEKPVAKPNEPDVKTLMKQAHEGKDSPLALIKREVTKDEPDWSVLVKSNQPLRKLASLIKDNETYTSRPGPYIAAVKALDAAAKKHDLKAARLAVAGLNKSCAGCHYGK